MTCHCPKCAAKIAIDLSQIPDGVAANTCPECKTHFVLTRESFARRAYRKKGEINCAECGEQLGHTLHCPECKSLYPEYLAAEFPDAARKRANQNRDLFSSLKIISFEWRPKTAPASGYKPVRKESAHAPKTVDLKRRKIIAGVCTLVILALAAVATNFYLQNKAKKQYVTTYVMALYGIKTGADLSLKSCAKISADWKAKTDAGQNTPPRIISTDEAKLTKIKTQTDKYLQKMTKPPSKFAKANEDITRLNEIYTKLQSAAINPSSTLSGFDAQVSKAETDFKQAASELKKNLSDELSTEFEIGKSKYRGLKEL